MRTHRIRRAGLYLAGAALLLTVGHGLAQTVEGLDISAIRKRAADQAEEAAGLSAEVARRTETLKGDAETVRAAALEQVRRIDPARLPRGPAGAIDFDEIVTAAADNLQDNRGDAPLFMVFVSLSMPEDSLRRVIDDVSRAGGVVVFRGFPQNSARQFVARLSKVIDDRSRFASIGIDPRLFRAFEVSAVPAYVVASTDFDLCDGLACRTVTPPHDRIIGNVTVDHALEAIVESRGPGALVAGAALKNLRGSPR